MEFLKGQKRFDFVYGGKPFEELDYEVFQKEEGNVLTTTYIFSDGLKITNIATKYGEAYEWVNWLENTGDTDTQIISELWDGCVSMPLPHEEPLRWTAYQPEFEELTTVYAPSGSTWSYDEFCSFPDRSADNRYPGHLTPGKHRYYYTNKGRSSNKSAPFFNIHKQGVGYIYAIGWTGQWLSFVRRTEDEILIKTKVENTNFKLFPGEKIRTSSLVIMPYEGTVIESQNKWRRLVKEHFSLIGQEGRDNQGPLCASVWGGMRTSSVLERVETMRKYELPYEYLWMDAGWYGANTQPTPDEFEGDWPQYTGDWRVSPLIHSNNLKDVADAVHAAGMKFLLWFEPEHVRPNTPTAVEHPEYFLEIPGKENLLLNLGMEKAWKYCFDTIAGMIESIGIDCYRQDFNTDPLECWCQNDAEDRLGITEIKHINGLYRLWDALLEKFPHLLIDNCASGGRRIDIETLRRSIPLWRSDYQCTANYCLEGGQSHHLTFNQWMPYSGTGSGRGYDTYRMRSAYSPAFMTAHSFSEKEAFGDEPEKMQWMKQMLEEYLKVRPLMEEDFYPLTQVTDRTDTWTAAQFDRPSKRDGMVQVFRREQSPYESASFKLYAVDEACDYIFTDADDDSKFVVSGAELAKKGFAITIPEKRTAKLFFYKKK